MIEPQYQYVTIRGIIQDNNMNKQPRIKLLYELTSDDYRNARKRTKRFIETKRGSSYMTRGAGSRWTRVNVNRSAVLTNGGVIIDISKLSDTRNITRHVSIMHKIAHKIKVNALKPANQTGDKRV